MAKTPQKDGTELRLETAHEHRVGVKQSAPLELALRAEPTAHRDQLWREENRAAIEESNAELERNGLWADKYRTW